MTQTNIRVAAGTIAIVLAFATFVLYTLEASADYDRGRGGDDGNATSIDVENKATVSNTMTITAKTGGNDANGGDGDDGGNGGDTREGTAGRGGSGGSGGAGGSITSGDAEAWGTLFNDINRTDVYVAGCGCEDNRYPMVGRMSYFSSYFDDKEGATRLDIDVENRARVTNTMNLEAMTGGNDANGGDGDDGGDGGDTGDRGHRMSKSWNNWFAWWNTDTAGAGGTGGNGGDAGTVRSGAAYANGLVDNLVNRTVVRSMADEELVD